MLYIHKGISYDLEDWQINRIKAKQLLVWIRDFILGAIFILFFPILFSLRSILEFVYEVVKFILWTAS